MSKLKRKNFILLFILFSFTVLIFGGCGGSGMVDEYADYIQPGRYYVSYAENFDNQSLNTDSDSYISVFGFDHAGYDDYEISFSGILFWRDYFGPAYYDSVPQRSIILTRVDEYAYETKYNSDPYVYIEIFDYENFVLYTDDFMVNLEYEY